MKNKIFFILILIFSLFNLLDIITAFFILPGESNPIYLIGGEGFLLLIKIAINIILIWTYQNNTFSTQFVYFNLLTITVLAIFLFGVGVYGNIIGMLNPEVIEYASNLSTGEKLQSYGIMVGLFAGVPFLFNLITFKLWQHSKKYIIVKRKIK